MGACREGRMKPHDYLVNLILSVILIVGTYQFYFLTQRKPLFKTRVYHSRLDEAVPFWPSWAWIYSFLYYPAILYLNWIATDARQFAMMAFSFILLLGMQMSCFTLFPVATPPHWRSINAGERLSERFLRFVQKFDAPSNCFPSMHVSVAVLTAFHAVPSLGPAAFLFPVLIALSCVFTKQHYLVDLPFGALLGWLAYRSYVLLMA
jgi:membrane-associated phospholipid phosphatase